MVIKGVLTDEEYNSLIGTQPLWKDEYKQGEDKRWYADVAGVDGWAFENVTNLKSTMTEERRRREEWERKHTELKNSLEGADPEEIKKIQDYKDKIAEMESWSPDEKVQARIAAVEEQYKKKLADETGGRDETIQARDSEISRLLIDAEARRVFGKLKGDAGLLLPHVYSQARVVRGEDGKTAVQVVDPQTGDPVVSKKPGATGNMGLEELCESFKERYPGAFTGSQASGGGAPAAGGGAGTNGNPQVDTKASPTERLKQMRRQSMA